jgi:putative SOS response-associated peptidase YedK
MCANYEPPAPRHLRLHLRTLEPTFSYPGEAYPGSKAVFVTAGEKPQDDFSPWPGVFGLLPPWAKDDKLARSTYNARSETVAEKPSFRQAWKGRRFCLIPVQSVFEPNYESGHAVRWRIARQDGLPFFLAGSWEEAHRQEQPLWSFSAARWQLPWFTATATRPRSPVSPRHGRDLSAPGLPETATPRSAGYRRFLRRGLGVANGVNQAFTTASVT